MRPSVVRDARGGRDGTAAPGGDRATHFSSPHLAGRALPRLATAAVAAAFAAGLSTAAGRAGGEQSYGGQSTAEDHDTGAE